MAARLYREAQDQNVNIPTELTHPERIDPTSSMAISGLTLLEPTCEQVLFCFSHNSLSFSTPNFFLFEMSWRISHNLGSERVDAHITKKLKYIVNHHAASDMRQTTEWGNMQKVFVLRTIRVNCSSICSSRDNLGKQEQTVTQGTAVRQWRLYSEPP